MTISRRTFVKSLAATAAGLLVPIVNLRPTIDREALMLPFCGDIGSRYDFSAPFGIGSLTYATDNLRVIRAELTCREECGERRLPSAAHVESFWREMWQPAGEFRDFRLPRIDELRHACLHDMYRECPECGGRIVSCGDYYPGYEQIEEFARQGLTYDVDENAVSDASCSVCRGQIYVGPHLVRIGEDYYSRHLLIDVANLPGVRVTTGAETFAGRSLFDRPLLFEADGFEGIVMPVWRKSVVGVK